MACMACTSNFEESELISILDDCPQDFPNIQALRREQHLCLVNLACEKDVFAILPAGFGKSLIFQLSPRLPKAAIKSEMCSIMVVSPLVSVMRQLKQLGFSVKNTRKTKKWQGKGSVKLFSVVQRPGYQALVNWNCEIVNLVSRHLQFQSMKFT